MCLLRIVDYGQNCTLYFVNASVVVSLLTIMRKFFEDVFP